MERLRCDLDELSGCMVGWKAAWRDGRDLDKFIKETEG